VNYRIKVTRTGPTGEGVWHRKRTIKEQDLWEVIDMILHLEPETLREISIKPEGTYVFSPQGGK
jgi:hypothetical protein